MVSSGPSTVTAAAPRIGVLALQGDVREHARMLEQLGAQVSLVRRPAELDEVDGLAPRHAHRTVVRRWSTSGAAPMRTPTGL